MGIPWQCDAFSCQQVLYANDLPNAIWWPALLPIDVLPESSYNQLMRKDLAPDVRLKFAANRVAWSRGGRGSAFDRAQARRPPHSCLRVSQPN